MPKRIHCDRNIIGHPYFYNIKFEILNDIQKDNEIFSIKDLSKNNDIIENILLKLNDCKNKIKIINKYENKSNFIHVSDIGHDSDLKNKEINNNLKKHNYYNNFPVVFELLLKNELLQLYTHNKINSIKSIDRSHNSEFYIVYEESNNEELNKLINEFIELQKNHKKLLFNQNDCLCYDLKGNKFETLSCPLCLKSIEKKNK
jgi:hypothetical protein